MLYVGTAALGCPSPAGRPHQMSTNSGLGALPEQPCEGDRYFAIAHHRLPGQPWKSGASAPRSTRPSGALATVVACYHSPVPPLLDIRHLTIDFPQSAARTAGEPGTSV